MRTTPAELKALQELLGPFVEMGLVEVAVAADGEVFYRRAPGFSDEEWLAAWCAISERRDLDA